MAIDFERWESCSPRSIVQQTRQNNCNGMHRNSTPCPVPLVQDPFHHLWTDPDILSLAPSAAHLQWPASLPTNPTDYQKAWDSMQLQSQQGGHPESDLADIFGKDDRVAAYQTRCADSINTVPNAQDMGASVSYSGCLIENINNLAENNWQNSCYVQNWNQTYAQERQKTTSGGFPKMDLVSFTYHHALAPLIDKNALKREIEIHKVIYEKTWGSSPGYSKGFFPAEMAFSERMIPTLVEQGIEWVYVANNHISRCCKGYPFSPSGDNNDPPNPADQVNPKQSNYFKQSISRGCAPNNAYPYSYTPHYAKYVEPNNGTEVKIIVIPVAMAMSWDDGYACYSTSDIESLASANNPDHPMFFVFAHDGDNDFGGGYSYYMQCVPQFVNQALQNGYNPTTVQQYLHDYPVDEDDIVHVEDGAWVNADGDFGSPQFINWNWPLTDNTTTSFFNYDIPHGWQVNERNWAVITAAENVVETAEQMTAPCRASEIQEPSSDATLAEIAWHFFLPSLTSGYMYYGAILDMFDKQTVACNQAVYYGSKAISSANKPDQTPPSIWYVMRFPYNPGGYGAGSLWKYEYTKMPYDFYIYTFAYDFSGIKSMTAYIREDNDGINPIDDNVNEMYHPQSKSVGDWKPFPMTAREMPKGDRGGVKFDFFPTIIADEYYVQITGLTDVLLDYYISGIDNYGNEKSTDIYHVYVGNNTSTHLGH